MKDKKIDKVNQEIDKYISERNLITNKELVIYLCEKFKGEIEKEQLSLNARFKLSSLFKGGELERVSNGIYRKILNKNDEYLFREIDNEIFFKDNFKNEADLYDVLDTFYKNKWSFSYLDLKRRIGISEQLNKHVTININTKYNNRVEKLIKMAKEINVEISIIYLFDANNILLYSISEILSNDYLSNHDGYLINDFIKFNNYDPYDLLFYIGRIVKPTWGVNEKNKSMWSETRKDWIERNKFKENFKKVINGKEDNYG